MAQCSWIAHQNAHFQSTRASMLHQYFPQYPSPSPSSPRLLHSRISSSKPRKAVNKKGTNSKARFRSMATRSTLKPSTIPVSIPSKPRLRTGTSFATPMYRSSTIEGNPIVYHISLEARETKQSTPALIYSYIICEDSHTIFPIEL